MLASQVMLMPCLACKVGRASKSWRCKVFLENNSQGQQHCQCSCTAADTPDTCQTHICWRRRPAPRTRVCHFAYQANFVLFCSGHPQAHLPNVNRPSVQSLPWLAASSPNRKNRIIPHWKTIQDVHEHETVDVICPTRIWQVLCICSKDLCLARHRTTVIRASIQASCMDVLLHMDVSVQLPWPVSVTASR